MKFFKHFVDAHRGPSLQKIKRMYGVAGIGRYWILVELCAEKLRKESEEEFTAMDCSFVFDGMSLAQSLGYANFKQAYSYLQDIAAIDLCSVSTDGETVVCSMPNLLESMDRDSKRARKSRGSGAPKKKIKNKEEDKEQDKECAEPSAIVVPIPSTPKTPHTLEGLGTLIEEWGNTLKHFKINLDPKLDEIKLAGFLNRDSMGFEKTKFALIGMRFEEATSTFNPGKNVSLMRLMKPDMFEKFVKLGAQEQASADGKPKGNYSFLEGK